MKRSIVSIFIIAVILTFFVTATTYACTTFVLKKGDKIIFGRNLDWYSGSGLVIVNPRDIEKTAITNSPANALKWVSKFGSVTFNQIGRDLPFGGINESGLVVEHMTLDETIYPSEDKRYALNAFQWIQYQLDNFSSISEVINSDTLLRISDPSSKIHFLICDRTGQTAVIEFLNGKMICYKGNDLPLNALANSTYDESVSCYKVNCGTQTNPSLQHFCKAASQTREDTFKPNESIIDHAFNTLNSVSQQLFTKWSIVYDVTSMRVYFKVYETPVIRGENKIFLKQPPYDPETKIVDFKGLDFSCSAGAKIVDIDGNRFNILNMYFQNYTTDINREYILKAFDFYKGWGLNIELKNDELESLAKYPESFQCKSKR
jgi:penicillin V acylase-like amidase (Ntn superfamily)